MSKAKTALVLRTVKADMTSYGGFVWPKKGTVEAPDWEPTYVCGKGLHGLLWGEGDGSLLFWEPDAYWLVVQVELSELLTGKGELIGKCKFRRGKVIHCGAQKSATDYIQAHGGAGRIIVGGTATAGEGGTPGRQKLDKST